ncbi:GntR family transcriptional regulator [Clostridium sp. MCC353]|uniref:GntR family transcriptional regulator n=1 Tax=Clostridium sp. MCC353 TaxID=2592646 RepID=UPI001C02D0F6|nr:GntR family transcriptional regulator [Clostridium sp. MCC353]MBT9775224.1 GntR family transcriptional regulator [Clostridium sp. MCC353]
MTDFIYQDLRRQIINNTLHRDQRLVETQLANKYNVNKFHVNKALQMLERDHLVKHVDMKGYFVVGIDKNDMYEIAKIREMLENAIISDFLINASQEEIEEVKLFTQRKIAFLKAGLKGEAFKETSATFDVIYSCSPYHRMVEMLTKYKEYIDVMITKAFDGPDDVNKTIENSTLLYHVFDKRDCELLQKWIHIRYLNAVNKIDQQVHEKNTNNSF